MTVQNDQVTVQDSLPLQILHQVTQFGVLTHDRFNRVKVELRKVTSIARYPTRICSPIT